MLISSSNDNNLMSAARERITSFTVHRLFKDILINTGSNIRLLADDCIIYRKIMDISDIDKLQTDLNRLGEWAVEN
jgi:hypothetical protein